MIAIFLSFSPTRNERVDPILRLDLPISRLWKQVLYDPMLIIYLSVKIFCSLAEPF